jgi:hypothetical protein
MCVCVCVFLWRQGGEETRGGRQKFGGGSERYYSEVGGGRENNIFGLKGSHAAPASPSGRGKAYDQN